MDRWQKQDRRSYSRAFGLLMGLLAVYELYICGSVFAESRASRHITERSCVTKHGMFCSIASFAAMAVSVESNTSMHK